MSELLEGEDVRPGPRVGGESPGLAIAAAVAGQILALLAGVFDAVALNVVVVAALAGSVLAIAALAASAPAVRARRAVTALIGAQGLAAAIVLSGLSRSVPPALPLAALAAAAALGGAGLAVVRFASRADRPPTPLALAPRVAAIALVSQTILQLWAASSVPRATPLHAAGFLAQSALAIVLLASMATIALRLRHRWVLVGLLAWTVGWVASMADLGALTLWSLGGTVPMGRHPLHAVDAELVQIVTALGGLAIGAALVMAIRESRYRHSAMVLLAGYAAFALIAAVGEHRIDLAADFPSIVALRKDRDLADRITDVALAGMLWLYWRRVVASAPGAIWDRT